MTENTEMTSSVTAPEQPATKAKGKSAKATPEPELGNPQGITINGNTAAVAKPVEKPTKVQRAARAKKVAPLTKVNAPKSKAAPKPTKKTAKPAKAGGRREQLIALLSRKGGAKLTEIMKAFKYQAHSVRGAVSILGKDYKIESTKVDGDRLYRIK
jgi:hypothetical protein